MTNPLHAQHYADSCVSQAVVVTHQRELAEDTYMVRFACADLAARVQPGQFVMVRGGQGADPLLGRAFAMYDVVPDAAGQAAEVEIVFHVVGKLTRQLATAQAGDRYFLWGPLGNGFQPEPVEHLVMVAGGIGQTPFLSVAKEYLGKQTYGRPAQIAQRVTLCYGARSQRYFAGLDEFRAAGVQLKLATDDGSEGHHGLVTDMLEEILTSDCPNGASPEQLRIVCCGPEPMMEAVARIGRERNVRTQVSLETPMACGMGICFSCVTRVQQADGWDYKRTCVDGPVFEGEQIVW